MALLPFFNAIGTVEKVSADDFHKEAIVMSKSVGVRMISLNQKALEFDVDTGPCSQYDSASGPKPAGASDKLDSCIKGQRALAMAEKIDKQAKTNSALG